MSSKPPRRFPSNHHFLGGRCASRYPTGTPITPTPRDELSRQSAHQSEVHLAKSPSTAAALSRRTLRTRANDFHDSGHHQARRSPTMPLRPFRRSNTASPSNALRDARKWRKKSHAARQNPRARSRTRVNSTWRSHRQMTSALSASDRSRRSPRPRKSLRAFGGREARADRVPVAERFAERTHLAQHCPS